MKPVRQSSSSSAGTCRCIGCGWCWAAGLRGRHAAISCSSARDPKPGWRRCLNTQRLLAELATAGPKSWAQQSEAGALHKPVDDTRGGGLDGGAGGQVKTVNGTSHTALYDAVQASWLYQKDLSFPAV
jgi:hypothetical protein